jgi:hypothetical protein
MGVLSWLIEDGAVDGIELSGLPVSLALRYGDDEPGSPWTWVLYLAALRGCRTYAMWSEITHRGSRLVQ